MSSPRTAGQKLTPAEAKQIRDLLKQGHTLTYIVKKMHISMTTAKRFRKAEGYIGQSLGKTEEAVMKADEEKMRWLQKNWNWVVPAPERKKGAVTKGYKSNFRTPSRPDGVWQ